MRVTCAVSLLAAITTSALASAEGEQPAPRPGMPSAEWQRASDAVLISDLSVCTPKGALSEKRKHGRWKVIEYETPSFAGKCVAAGPLTDAPPITLPFKLTGWHAVYLGLAWHYDARNMVRVKLTGDAAYQHRSHNATQEQIEEVFFKCADLTGRNLHFAQQFAGYGQAAVIMYAKLVPMTDDEVQAVKRDANQRGTKRLLATIDGHGYLYDRMPTTKEELLEEFENYRDSDFGAIWYGGAEVGLASQDLPKIDDWVGQGYKQHWMAIRTLQKKGISINGTAVEACHSMGIKIHMSLRPSGWAHPVPFEDYDSELYLDHPEWRCYDKDGTPVTRMSFAVPEVRKYLVDVFRKSVESGADGVNVLFDRGCSVILWEEPFCKLFQEKYGEDAKKVADDDPRILDLRAEIMTGFFGEVRQMLDEVQQEKRLRRKLEISAMLLGTEALNRRFGFDVPRWIKEGLIDAIGMDWAAFDAYSMADGGGYYDMDYYERITKGTKVPVYPVFNPIEWESVGDPAATSHGYRVGDVRTRTAGYYDAGAEGCGFWDVSGAVTDATLWPVVSRLGHADELRQFVGRPKPARVTYPITRWAGVVYGGRYNPWAGG